jgi:hypothetical protein
MKKLKQKILILISAVLLTLSLSPAMVLADAKSEIQCGANNAAGVDCGATPPSTDLNGTVKTIINLLSVIVGIVAVVMIIIAGYRYITSGGAAEKVSSAKSSLIYALVGIVIVALAQVIVRFVLTKATTST